MNPYDFVPLLEQKPKRKAPLQGHEKFSGQSGRLICTLEAITPLFTPDSQSTGSAARHKSLNFHRVANIPTLPGSSLKGVIRNVAEAAANACFTLPNPPRFSYELGRVRYHLPDGFQACEDVEKLCRACRLFGMLNQGKVFAGNTTVQDATVRKGHRMERMTLAILSSPKPRHTPFYSQKPDQDPAPIRGRKFYFHRPQGPLKTSQKSDQNATVEAILPDAIFDFEVEYSNLADEDLDLLLFSLSLWDDACHKIGMGKPIGLGSAKIDIVEWHRLDRAIRYRRLKGGWAEPLQGEALAREVDRRTAGYRAASTPNLEDLHRILRWDAQATVDIRYPDQQWFRENPRTLLEDAP